MPKLDTVLQVRSHKCALGFFGRAPPLASGCPAWACSLLAAGFCFAIGLLLLSFLRLVSGLFSSLEVCPKSRPDLKAVDHSPELSVIWWINPLTGMVDALCLPGCSVTSPILALAWGLCTRNISFFYSWWWTKKRKQNPVPHRKTPTNFS